MKDKISVLISEEEINARIAELGEQISKDFAGEKLHLVCILRGSVFFACELAKRITVPVTIDFMTVSSYGNQTSSGGVIHIKKDLEDSLEGRNVIVIEDIVDTGNTLSYLLELMKVRKPRELRLCTLLDKPDRREKEVKVDYIGFQIPDVFVVGYGLDYAQEFRNLPYIGVAKQDS